MANSRRPQLSIARPAEDAPATAAPFPLSTGVAPSQMTFSAEAEERLSLEEKDLARSFFTAWRRTGEFLLEAARWMTEARERVDWGNWALWLREVRVSDDLSEQLRNVWDRAQKSEEFAKAIREGRINTTTAYLLAPSSVPDTVVEQVIEAEEPLTTIDLRKLLQRSRQVRLQEAVSTPPLPAAPIYRATPAPPLDSPDIPAVVEGEVEIPNNSEIERSATRDADSVVLLKGEERDQIRALTRVVSGYAEAPETLHYDDWALLSDLYRALDGLVARMANQ